MYFWPVITPFEVLRFKFSNVLFTMQTNMRDVHISSTNFHRVISTQYETTLRISMSSTFHQIDTNFYRPQRSWGKVIFSQASVILFTVGESASVHAGIPYSPPQQDKPPWQGDPPCTVHAGRYGQQAGSMHPTGMQFLLPATTKLGQGNVFTSVCLSTGGEGCLPQCMLRYTPPPGADPPWEQTPRPDTPPGPDTPRSRHPRTRHPPGSRLQHTVNERPVRILLECILV